MLESYDELTRRCPPLGGEVPFKYCRSMNKKLPCHRVVECWCVKFEIADWLNENFTPEQIQQALTPDSRTRLDKILQIAYDACAAGEDKAEK